MKKILLVLITVLGWIVSPLMVDAETLTVTDATGEITLDTNIEKIVVLGYSEYDTLRELGLENLIVGAPKAMVPEYIGEIPETITDVGTLKEPNLEVISQLEPDLIIANGRTQNLVEELKQIAPVFVLSLDSENFWESFTTQNESLAKLLNREEIYQQQLVALKVMIDAISEYNEANPETTLVLMLNEGAISAFSANSRFGLIFQVLNFKPVDETIEDSRHGQEMSYESILAINPERILYLDRSAAIGGDTSKNEGFLDNEIIQETKASQSNQIDALASDLWYLGGSGLESVRLEIQQIADLLPLDD